MERQDLAGPLPGEGELCETGCRYSLGLKASNSPGAYTVLWGVIDDFAIAPDPFEGTMPYEYNLGTST